MGIILDELIRWHNELHPDRIISKNEIEKETTNSEASQLQRMVSA